MSKLKVICINRGEHWFAQGLEVDFAATGRTLEETMANFERNLVAQVALDEHHGNAPLEHFKPAPLHFWAMWSEGVGMPFEVSLPTGVHV